MDTRIAIDGYCISGSGGSDETEVFLIDDEDGIELVEVEVPLDASEEAIAELITESIINEQMFFAEADELFNKFVKM